MPCVIVPADAVEQDQEETTAVPLDERFEATVLLKLQLFVVFKLNVFVPVVVGVPVAVNTTVCEPVELKVLVPANVTPFVIIDKEYVPIVVTNAVIV